MLRVLRSIYYFLPVQLLLLHARKYQLLLAFWLLLLLILTGNFASHFGAVSLFLAPEYLGKISFFSMMLLGCALCVFIMMWHITTFIVHSKRMPYMGATRHAFVVYCINNSVIPIAFLIFYSIVSVRYQIYGEQSPIGHVLLLQLGFYFGILLVGIVSFFYFFRVSRDFFKSLLSGIANPSRIRGIIPYDSLDYEIDIIHTRSFISGDFKIVRSEDLEPYHPRVMNTILRRHHRNVIFAALVSYLLLLLFGIFIEQPLLRIPAGAGFLLLFSIVLGIVGAFKYFLKSWETLGWVMFILLLSSLVKYRVVDLRSIAYGLNYNTPEEKQPEYSYNHLRDVFTPERFAADKNTELGRLARWKSRVEDSTLPPLVVIGVSGGGSRSAYWTFRTLQYLDSASHGKLFKNTVLISGASGGLIGATYWRSIHDAQLLGKIKNPYDPKYQENIGKDLLNAIIFSLASVDLVSPFNKISFGGYSYTRDRGFAMEQEMIRNTEGLLDKNIGYFRQREAAGQIPQLIINGTIINDGRKLMISNQPVGYLTQAAYSLKYETPPIDAVDFATFFAEQDPYNLRLTSALRMNATFPFVLPVVRFPSQPRINIMDAGLRDNFGAEIATRYIFTMRDWLLQNTSKVIFLEIRDTREYDVSSNSDESTLGGMVTDPIFVIQNKWEAFQSYGHGFVKDFAPFFLGSKLKFVTFQYVPKESKKVVALNFHLTQREQEDLYQSIYHPGNQAAVDTMLSLLK
ncbi:MAG: patatin-like phospholipase family protein [Bacteroidota bacterium]